ncbi:hypothetical protein PC111_g18058 [Phytophthora cactorum]|nr:hypothetical protein PC111_g18058 [Phytophthora cactorum]
MSWGKILHYVAHIDNLSVTKALGNSTPFEKLKNRKPDLKDVKVCGCVAYHHVPKEKQENKFEMRAKPAIFLGMADSQLCYRLLDLETGDTFQRRRDYVEKLMARRYYGKQTRVPNEIPYVLLPVNDVAVTEPEAPTEELEDKCPDPSNDVEDVDMSSSDCSDWEYIETVEHDDSHGSACGATANRVDTSGPTTTENATATACPGGSGNAGTGGSPNASTGGNGGSARPHQNPRRSGRQRRSNRRYNPKNWIMTWTLMQRMLIGAVNDILNPTSRQEALASEHAEGWRHAMDLEYAALMQNGTWELVPRPKWRKGRHKPNILTSLWVVLVKRNERGEIERLKARLAIRGFLQKFGIDYLCTYSPVVRIESVRLILLIAMFLGLECKHIDFVTAFLNGELIDVVIYMEQPEGYEDGTDRVCRLRKGLYGLKQASKIWNDTLHKVLIELGFVQCGFDAGVYWRRRNGRLMFLTVYVDDIVIAGVTSDIDDVIHQLALRFKLKNLGRVRHLLGMEVNYLPGRMVCLSQTAYIERLAEMFGLALQDRSVPHNFITRIPRRLRRTNQDQ